jgi:hypothetical protein
LRDLSSKGLIVTKGLLFLVLAGAAALLLLLQAPSLRTGVLIVILVWTSCRFYYFLFYVLQHYVDSRLRYSGLLALLRQISRTRGVRFFPRCH